MSYRRGDTAGRAGRLVDGLVDRFGRDAVFHDVGSIAPGERFMDRIGAAIAQVDVLFAVIGPGWIASGSAGRRLDEVDDPVRLELEAALAAGRRIVPVLVDRASMPAAGDLPPSIAELAATNAFEVRDESWAADVQRMLLALGVVRAPLAVSRRRLLTASGGIAVAVASGVTIWRRSAGDSPSVESAGDWYPFRDAMSYGSLPTTSPEPTPVGIQTLEYRDPGDELDLELQAVQDRIMLSFGPKFVFHCSDSAKDTLLREGLDFKYGARHLKRSVERFLVYPLSNLVATEQIGLGDLVHIDLDEYTHKLIFSKSSGGALIHDLPVPTEEPEALESLSGGVGLPIPQATKAAKKSQSRGEKTES